VVTKQR